VSLKHLLFLDYETYYSREYSLKRMSVPEYVLDPRFQVTLMAAYDVMWEAPRIVLPADIPAFLAQYPACQTICCAHNALFDLSILAWKYGFVPGRMADTIGMVRALRNYRRNSLKEVTKELFGRDSKGDVIHKVIGLDAQGIKQRGLWGPYCSYALNDVRECAHIYLKLLPEFPPEERRVMDLVLRAAMQPVLHADVTLLQEHLRALRSRKAALLRDCGYDKAALMSTLKFQQALELLGVEIKSKISLAGNTVPAFAKTDPFMSELLEYNGSHDDDINYQVQTLAAARLSHRSTIEETRAERFINVAQLPWGNGAMLPVALRYGGAHTHRLSGEWSMNMQNLPRDKTKSKLRQALLAPPGTRLITADLAQIEARIVACLAGQNDLVTAFRDGVDVYARFAGSVFGGVVTKKTKPNERFIGKTAILGLGYGCGVKRFYQMVLTQARANNIPLDGLFDYDIAQDIVDTYRKEFFFIKSSWYKLDELLKEYINNENPDQWCRWGPVGIHPLKVVLPNKMTLRYKRNDPHLYGAKLLENITQALARIVIMGAALRLAKRGYRFVLQAHDELVFVVPEAEVETAKPIIEEEMIRPPAWMPNLPLATEIGVGRNYGEAK
jgi:hypothetical protein